MRNTTNTSQIWVVDADVDQVEWLKTQTPPHVDQHLYNSDQTGVSIELVRHLAELLNFPPLQSSLSQHVVLYADSASLPAQQAFLKNLEEPPTYAQIILIVTQPSTLLPTILSRCLVQNFTTAKAAAFDQTTMLEHWQNITTADFDYTQRIKLAEALTDRTQAQTWLSNLAQTIHTQPNYPEPQQISALATIQQGLYWLSHNVSPKLAIEVVLFKLRLQK